MLLFFARTPFSQFVYVVNHEQEIDSLVMENCSFKRLVRGFVREQGPNYKVWNHVLIKNNLFYDCGYYNQGAGGYCWIAGINQPGSNLYKDFKVIENTFYDSPFPAFFSEENENYEDAQPAQRLGLHR